MHRDIRLLGLAALAGLARSDGVICPPDHIDSEIQAPTPPAGPMPVIPPPGTPGGDPSLRPK
ncbi:MAG: hypothetical protein HY244_10085 [Rhizobiales bacterium]|nr:hypothetical protein [Hyphomicrobiales bacterium]